MRQALPKGLVRQENVRIPKRRAAMFDFVREQTESSSDSEVARKALRHFEQFVEDQVNGMKLKVVSDGKTGWLTFEMFKVTPGILMERTSMILHQRSLERIERLRKMMNVDDLSEVICYALRYYAYIVTATTKDARFFVVAPSGEEFGIRIVP
jgi:hypothetical protein